ncbi:Pyruvate/Phosphoenolpyruvate kinase-like domain-containing protein [Mycena maculata]|uniref:Pyruvate/Phosphoenolpyruvate kinase-like domain-containing protein n=1 Tax=Mycena maculata TaxID=230809 RepID=A0AAD7P233_9AGAR|nr:Pyruvate/Phosphoenolpyruvate kinase-like domain-containing protein [Mycena maculata]
MPPNALTKAFAAHQPAFGVWLTSPGFFHARTVAQSSPHVSWVLIDCAQGLASGITALPESIAAVHGTDGPSALVRIPPSNTSWEIKQALDAGARGVLVPLVSTAEDARDIVVASCSTLRDTLGRGALSPDHPVTVLLAQIETRQGVANAKDIAEVDGIDVLFIGPYDLSIALGYPVPSPDPHPEVEKIIQGIRQAAHRAGKKCAIYCASGAQAAWRAAEGFDMINVTSDMGAMASGIVDHLSVAVAAGGGGELKGWCKEKDVMPCQFGLSYP